MDRRGAFVRACRLLARAWRVTTGVVEAGVDTWRLLFKTTRNHGAAVFTLGSYKAQTVYLIARNGRGRKLARAYDSGLLRGFYARGEAVRLEDQGPQAHARVLTSTLVHVSIGDSFRFGNR
jgi:hypothetical protein